MKWLGLGAMLFVAFMVASTMDHAEEVAMTTNYCEMVTIYKETGGESGWPDFRHTYDALC